MFDGRPDAIRQEGDQVNEIKSMEAYARLLAMRAHLPSPIPPSLADEFHSILELIESSKGVDLNAFRIPPEGIRRAQTVQVASEWGGAPMSSTTPAACDRSVFLMKLDGALGLFQLLDSAGALGKSPIGFRVPDAEGE